MNKLAHQNRQENGFSLVELLVVVVVIGILASIAVPNFLASQRAANEASAISGLRSIFSAQQVYASSNSGSFGSAADLYAAGHIDSTIGTSPHTKSRYQYAITADNSTPTKKFEVTAKPLVHTLVSPVAGHGTKNFGVNEVGVIYQRSDNADVTFDPMTRAAASPATPIGN